MTLIKNNGKILIMFIVFISIFTGCGVINKNSNAKNVDIYNVVKEAFLTDKGYSDELSKHMSEQVFKRTNIYNTYNVNSPDYKKPFKVEFSLKEDSQKSVNDIVYVKMVYSVVIKDSQNKSVGGSSDIPITFTVKKTGNDWYITEKEEAA